MFFFSFATSELMSETLHKKTLRIKMSYIEVKWCKEENQENKYSKKKYWNSREFHKTSVIQKIFFIFFSYFWDKSMKQHTSWDNNRRNSVKTKVWEIKHLEEWTEDLNQKLRVNQLDPVVPITSPFLPSLARVMNKVVLMTWDCVFCYWHETD